MSGRDDTEWHFASGVEFDDSGSTLPSALRRGGPRVGERWGPFSIQGELGRGGNACVYRAQLQGQEFALKVLLNPSPRSRQRLAREARVVGQLRHPGIVSLRGAGTVAEQPFVLYELVPGARPLSAAWNGLSTLRRVDLVAQVADAVGYAHGCGVLHRDLKPGNILVDDAGNPRVIDFGLARDEEALDLTKSGAWIGTPSYMAPEQFEASRDQQTAAVDVWSLGVLLYEALTERLPYYGKTVIQLASKIRDATCEPPSKQDPTLSPAVEAVCLRALQKAPGRRQLDAQAFARALRVASATPTSPRPPLPLVVGALALVLVLGGGTAWLLLSGDGPLDERPAQVATPAPAPSPFDTAGVMGVFDEVGDRETRRIARERLKVAPDDLKAHLALGLSSCSLNDYTTAVAECRWVLAKRPQNLLAIETLAVAAFNMGEIETALQRCTEGLELDSGRPRLWQLKSILATHRGRHQEAADAALRGLDRNPDEPSLLWSLGLAHANLGDHELALRYYDRSLERDDNVDSRFNRAASLLQLGRDEEALVEAENILARVPNDVRSHCLRVRCLQKLDPHEALGLAESLTERFHEHARVFRLLGWLHQRAGRDAQAITAYRRCLELDHERRFPEVRQLIVDLGG